MHGGKEGKVVYKMKKHNMYIQSEVNFSRSRYKVIRSMYRVSQGQQVKVQGHSRSAGRGTGSVKFSRSRYRVSQGL